MAAVGADLEYDGVFGIRYLAILESSTEDEAKRGGGGVVLFGNGFMFNLKL
jgi:hypothetical protein